MKNSYLHLRVRRPPELLWEQFVGNRNSCIRDTFIYTILQHILNAPIAILNFPFQCLTIAHRIILSRIYISDVCILKNIFVLL